MQGRGPVYCEMLTASDGWLFEPINTWTNLAPIAAGLLALWWLSRQRAAGAVPWVLALLLLATGVGSFVWHGFHERLALRVETLSGLLFFACYLFWWGWRLWGWLVGFAACLAFLGLAVGQLFVLRPSGGGELGLRVIAVTVPCGALLLWVTARRFGRAIFRVGAASLALGAAAASFRSLDLPACELVPFGTHFLWHILLALAAYTAIRVVVAADQAASHSSTLKSAN
jgi:hypothetical protein